MRAVLFPFLLSWEEAGGMRIEAMGRISCTNFPFSFDEQSSKIPTFARL